MTITKIVFCVRRHPSLSVDEFRDYWLHRHGPLVRSLWEKGTFPGMLRYVQSHTIYEADAGRLARGTKAPYDGITEVWMDSERGATDAATQQASAEAGRILLQDESTFIDFADSSVFVTIEHTIFE
jgi:uncharacterized protein (TIGR02118 family)